VTTIVRARFHVSISRLPDGLAVELQHLQAVTFKVFFALLAFFRGQTALDF
jgi:hypothetical protein